MAYHELLVLDPTEEATGRTELDITPWVADEGPDFGDAQIAAYMAESSYGSVPVDFRVPNRIVTIPIVVASAASVTFDQVRTKLQAKVGLWQREGGIVARENTRVGTVYADVVNATLKLGGSGLQAYGLIDADAVLTLECLPDWYGAEVSASPAHDESTLPELVWTETGIEGDYPGRARLVITERDADSQGGVLWGFRSRHYSSASTAALAYEAESLTPISPAATATQSGASGGGSNVIAIADLATSWTPVMNTNLTAGTYLTHVGSYRVWARVRVATNPDVQLRLVWDVGDISQPAENAPWQMPAAGDFYLADLGEVRLDQVPVGTHRWQGQIQGKGVAGGESVQIDRLFFQPIDESAGRLRAAPPTTGGLVVPTARDEFNQTAGNVAGKTLPIGGTWVGAGDADGFTIDTAGHTAQRTAVSDAYTGGVDGTPRFEIAGTSVLANTEVQADVKTSVSTPMFLGVVARYVDTSNYFAALVWVAYGFDALVYAYKRVAGAATLVDSTVVPGLSASAPYTIRLTVDTGGQYAIYWGSQGAQPATPTVTGQDSVLLATGGTLDDGKVGISDLMPTSFAATRNFDNFIAYAPTSDAALFASRKAEVRHDGTFREDSTGAAYGPASIVTGDFARVPVAGLEGRTTQVFVKGSRGDFETRADSGIDDIRGQLYYRPCWLQSPDDTGS